VRYFILRGFDLIFCRVCWGFLEVGEMGLGLGDGEVFMVIGDLSVVLCLASQQY